MPTINIVSRWDRDTVLYTHETTDERVSSGMATRDALEAATRAGAYLDGANLAGAYLAGAYLAGANLAGAYLAGAYLAGAYLAGANLARANLARANLAGAYLAGAYLAGAYLAGANLARANLAGANLDGANLTGANLARANLARANLARANLARANLTGANLDGANGKPATLIGDRPVLYVGPIGSRGDTASLWLTDAGPLVRAGCFWGQLDAFAEAVQRTHGDSVHGREYRAAIALMRVHAECWTPALADTKD